MTNFELGFLSLVGSLVSGFWNTLCGITFFGMSLAMILVSGLAIMTIMPFFLQFLSSGTGYVFSKESSVYHSHSRQVDAGIKKRRPRVKYEDE